MVHYIQIKSVINLLEVFPKVKKHSGFTLIEIMVVVVIIGLLSALVGPRLIGQSEDAKKKTTAAQISQLEQVLGLYHLDNGFYPTTNQGLEALVKEPTMPPEPLNYKKGGYMKKVPKDAWGREFIYVCPGEHSDFDISSYGPDGQEGGDDDILNWE